MRSCHHLSLSAYSIEIRSQEMGKCVLLGVMMVIMAVGVGVGEATPPGIANHPSHASCNIKKYKHCYTLVHVCPKFCPNGCTVECASCKPICSSSTPDHSSTPSPTPYNPPPPSSPTTPPSTPDHSTPSSTPYHNPPSPTPTTPSPPSSPTPPPSTPDHSPSPPSNPTTPSSPNYSPPPPSSTPSTPPSTPSTPDHSPSPPPSTPSTPSTPTTPSAPDQSPSPPPTPTTPSPSKTARCKNKNYPLCYNMDHVCPAACPTGCDVDCVTCKPVCKCDKPGAVCQDPRFVGGDGITFYFHGKKDSDFCLVSDPNLHINAHFIGRRNPDMNRDFTWVQSIAILFNNHHIFVGAQKTATWNDHVDRLALTFDGQPLALHQSEGSTWESDTYPRVVITRAAETNYVVVEIEGRVRIIAKVVPITEEDSRIHNYGITKEDCFAHLDLGFKFMSLSDQVSGVLGQTYKPDYVSRVNIKAKMPVMGGEKEFKTTGLFVADCSVSRFAGNDDGLFRNASGGLVLPDLSCSSGIAGQGVVCKK